MSYKSTHIDDPKTQSANLAYIRGTMNTPILEKERERMLARLWKTKRDEKALHELVNAYARLVVAAASKFRHYGLPIGDLIQEGNIGLMMAAERFDYKRDVRFSTYATWWIRSCIQDFILRNWSIVRTGTTSAQKSLFFNLRRLRAKIENRQEHEGLTEEGRAEIARSLNVKIADVREMEGRMSGGDQSLNALVGEDGQEEWQNFLADGGPNPEDIAITLKDSQTRSAWLAQALGDLSERERTIIHSRHLSGEAVTLEDLGKELGISKERVRQLEQRAMDKLKNSITRQVSDPQDLFAAA
ncbi:MAG: RNA polymerase factor sigma-32 [Alphaproteobacteria bacterium]|nr:RNA polymerase factor sigma-32 [Alphaproteobacteria bacterium]